MRLRTSRLRDAIVAGALDELATVGYGELSTLQFSDTAGLQPPFFCHRALTRGQRMATFLTEATAHARPVDADSGSTASDLRLLADAFESALDDPLIALAARASMHWPQSEAAHVRAAFLAPYEATATRVIARASARGESIDGLAAAELVELIAAPLWPRHTSGGAVARSVRGSACARLTTR